MCEYSNIINQFKDMFGLDYGAMANNLVREILVGSLDFKPAINKVKSMKTEALDCVKTKEAWVRRQKEDAEAEAETWTESGGENSDAWDIFISMDSEDLKKEAMNCIPDINRFEIGETIGELFSSFFDNSLKPLV